MFNLFYMNALVQGQSSSLLFATETHQAQAPLKLINVNKNYIFNRLGFHTRVLNLPRHKPSSTGRSTYYFAVNLIEINQHALHTLNIKHIRL